MNPAEHRLFRQPWPEGEYRLFQLGFLVDDLVATAAQWADVFGVGPFHVLPRREVPYVHRGSPSMLDMQVGVAQAGPVQIELVEQHCDRPSVFRDAFGADGSGLHQLCTVAPDYDGTIAHYEARGHALAGEFPSDGQRVGFVDTLADFGFFTEVVEQTPAFLAQLALIDRTCAGWDGTDPVRLLTRDGYRTP